VRLEERCDDGTWLRAAAIDLRMVARAKDWWRWLLSADENVAEKFVARQATFWFSALSSTRAASLRPCRNLAAAASQNVRHDGRRLSFVVPGGWRPFLKNVCAGPPVSNVFSSKVFSRKDRCPKT
jgi:hypothetical protein